MYKLRKYDLYGANSITIKLNDNNHYEKKLFKLREAVNRLFFNHHFSKSMISKKKRVSRNFVIKWTESPNQDFTKDIRGWPKGKTRKYPEITEGRIKRIHQELVKDLKVYFAGASAILQRWQELYPLLEPPNFRFIGRTLKKYNLSKKIQKGKNKGASKYLHYPEYSIHQLGESLLEIDFIGKKFIKGQTAPLNFIGFSLINERKLKHFRRISGETADNIIRESERFFKNFEKPEVVKIDNGFAMAGVPLWPRVISKVPLWFLKEKITPIFTPPRKPWSQASIEGANSVFSRKFWNRFDFKNISEVDERLNDFNNSYQWYLGYKRSNKNFQKDNFIPKIYFIRKVHENPQTNKGFIELANEKISLPKSYINFFTLGEWNLKEEFLYVYFENEQKPQLIKKIPFKINQKSKEKLEKLLKN
ncbi:MAG: hypothetical protein ACOZAL_00035 [Patescibacteria group bacterium]